MNCRQPTNSETTPPTGQQHIGAPSRPTHRTQLSSTAALKRPMHVIGMDKATATVKKLDCTRTPPACHSLHASQLHASQLSHKTHPKFLNGTIAAIPFPERAARPQDVCLGRGFDHIAVSVTRRRTNKPGNKQLGTDAELHSRELRWARPCCDPC